MLVEAQLDLLNTDDWDTLLEYDVDFTDIQEQNANRLPENTEEDNRVPLLD